MTGAVVSVEGAGGDDVAKAMIRQAVTRAGTAFMIVDANFDIVYCNDATMTLLRRHEEEFKKVLPGFRAEDIMGMSIDRFHRVPSHQRAILTDRSRPTFDARTRVGNLVLRQHLTQLRDEKGEFIGATMEWEDFTAQMEIEGKIKALDKVQAVIEFAPDGTVLDANANFLATLGYTLDEIRGRHHRMFCDPGHVASPAYAEFWEKLRRGEFDAGEYRRVGKGGKEVWIQASYNPILDAAGRVLRVVKFATDVTAQKLQNAEYEGKVAAIGKSQVVIEFALDGTVLTANENFLLTLGYSLDEIRGRHHRMFCDPAYVNTPAYAAFWEKLRRGEFDSGEYQRFGKGGRELWIQASYNPIFDVSGRPFKVVKFATDITEARRRSQAYATEVQRVIAAVRAGDLKVRGDLLAMDGEYRAMLGGLNDVIEAAVSPVITALGRIVDGVTKVNDLVAEIAAASSEQARGIAQVDQGLRQVDQVTQQNTAGAEESAAASDELSAQANRLREMLGKFRLRQKAAATVGHGLSPELIAAVQAFLAQQGQSPPRPPAPPRPAARKPASAASNGSNGSNGHGLSPAMVIPLDDTEFGRY